MVIWPYPYDKPTELQGGARIPERANSPEVFPDKVVPCQFLIFDNKGGIQHVIVGRDFPGKGPLNQEVWVIVPLIPGSTLWFEYGTGLYMGWGPEQPTKRTPTFPVKLRPGTGLRFAKPSVVKSTSEGACLLGVPRDPKDKADPVIQRPFDIIPVDLGKVRRIYRINPGTGASIPVRDIRVRRGDQPDKDLVLVVIPPPVLIVIPNNLTGI
jgi:hypothetical protein